MHKLIHMLNYDKQNYLFELKLFVKKCRPLIENLKLTNKRNFGKIYSLISPPSLPNEYVKWWM